VVITPGRRLLAGGVLAGAIVAAIWWPRGSAFAIASTADQNVLIVTIDTLRADALGSYGGRAATPRLDRLAAHGARFTFAHAHAVVTLPSHTTILSGQLPYEHGMRDNSGYRVRPDTVTLATGLKAQGVATGAFVGGFPLTERFGLGRGFDVYDDEMPEMHGAVTFSMPERRADVVVSRAVDWIGKQTTRFFAWVHVFDPHAPYKPPDEFASKYASQPYDGEVAWVDRALGPLFDRLASLARPTLVIVTSDHGESLGEHGELTHGMFAYEATLRVPLIVGQLGSSAPPLRGVVIDTPVRHIDLAPTVLEALDAEPDQRHTGTSLVAVIRERHGPDRPSYFESMTYHLVRGWAPLRGVLVEREKYIDLPIPELYDLAADPKEARNLATPQGDRTRVLAKTLRTFNVAPPERPGRENADVTAALRSLGYVSGTAAGRKNYTEDDDPKRLVEVDRDLHTASDFFQNGKVDDAIAVLNRVIARRPDTADAYLSLGHAYWEAGQPQRAIETLERALIAGAPDRDIRIRLGLYLAESHTDTKRAITLLETLPEGDVEAMNGLGVAYADAGRLDDAVRTLKRVLSLDSTNALAYQNLASISLREAATVKGPGRDQKLQDAESLIRQALQADSTLAKAHTTLGVILSTTGRKPAAIDSWKRAVELDAAEFDALYNLWFELAAEGRRDDAVRYGRQFVSTAPPAFYKADIDRVSRYLQGR
jgi:arylsulfatase A-like enzyme/Flp pilus assembly protein TadD